MHHLRIKLSEELKFDTPVESFKKISGNTVSVYAYSITSNLNICLF